MFSYNHFALPHRWHAAFNVDQLFIIELFIWTPLLQNTNAYAACLCVRDDITDIRTDILMPQAWLHLQRNGLVSKQLTFLFTYLWVMKKHHVTVHTLYSPDIRSCHVPWRESARNIQKFKQLRLLNFVTGCVISCTQLRRISYDLLVRLIVVVNICMYVG